MEELIYEHLMESKEKLASLQDQIKDKEIMIFLGNTRSGKSTLINYLLGTELEAYESRVNTYKLIKVDDDADGPNIGQGALSKTAVPGIYKRGDSIIIDTPGFSDNRGEAQAIVNAIYLNQIKHCRSCKFVLVSDINDIIHDNVGKFLSFVKSIHELLPGVENLVYSAALILTKDMSDYKNCEIADRIKEQIILNTELKFSKAGRRILETFAKNEKLIGFLRTPTKCGAVTNEIDIHIEEALSEASYLEMPHLKVGYVVSSEVHTALFRICAELIDKLDLNNELDKVYLKLEAQGSHDSSPSIKNELLQMKSDLTNVHSRFQSQHNVELEEVLSSLMDIIKMVDDDFYKTFKLLIMLDEAKLLNKTFKNSLIKKYEESVINVRSKIDGLLQAIEESENNVRGYKIANIVGNLVMATGTATVALGETAFVTGVAAAASTGIGLLLLAGGAVVTGIARYGISQWRKKKNTSKQRQG